MDKFETKLYSNQLKADLDLFNRWQVLIDALSTTDSMPELLAILQKILAFDSHQSKMVRIDNEYWFPTTHWVTIAFAKIAEQASLSPTKVVLPNAQKVAELHFAEWPNAAFRFMQAPLAAGGYYLVETAQNLRVLYWDTTHKRFYLDTNQFAKLVQTQAVQLAGLDALATFQKRLTAIASQLIEVAYDIMLPGLDAHKQVDLEMIQKDLSTNILDSLFVLAAKQQFILKRMTGEKHGAMFTIGEVSLKLTQHHINDGHEQWTYDIIDDNRIVTIYTLFQQLPFFYQWYSDHLTVVGLKNKREVFVD
ncbi:hypothetical protein [uncultured Leuconostoc sp.]|uniref:hypothetical protein n=1 Tax=uncultured Leuconostoc sp. TaxID=173262 RepID=UPI0025DAC3C4|nr:hypothetical protein [uncultured Leuconostoc sp.]